MSILRGSLRMGEATIDFHCVEIIGDFGRENKYMQLP